MGYPHGYGFPLFRIAMACHGAIEAWLDAASAASIRADVVAIVAVLAVAQHAIATNTRLAQRDLASAR